MNRYRQFRMGGGWEVKRRRFYGVFLLLSFPFSFLMCKAGSRKRGGKCGVVSPSLQRIIPARADSFDKVMICIFLGWRKE